MILLLPHFRVLMSASSSSAGESSARVELLYSGNTAAASTLSNAVGGWDGTGSADGERVRLAEGPLWDPATGVLYFIDILGKALHALHHTDGQPQQRTVHKQWSLPALPGTLCLTERSGVLLVAMQDGLYLFDTSNGQCVHSGVDCEPGVANNRCNDGKVDPSGRLVVGTMCLDESDAGKEKGGLYSVDGSISTGGGAGQWQCRQLLSGLSIPNGLAWSKDGRRFFHTDTPTRQIKEYHYNSETGDLSEGRVAITVPEEFGHPDGLTIDDEDMLWVASWSASNSQQQPATASNSQQQRQQQSNQHSARSRSPLLLSLCWLLTVLCPVCAVRRVCVSHRLAVQGRRSCVSHVSVRRQHSVDAASGWRPCKSHIELHVRRPVTNRPVHYHSSARRAVRLLGGGAGGIGVRGTQRWGQGDSRHAFQGSISHIATVREESRGSSMHCTVSHSTANCSSIN